MLHILVYFAVLLLTQVTDGLGYEYEGVMAKNNFPYNYEFQLSSNESDIFPTIDIEIDSKQNMDIFMDEVVNKSNSNIKPYDGYYVTFSKPPVEPDEQRLYDKLMQDYNVAVRPVNRADDRVVIEMGLTLAQIFDMDEKNQVLVTNVWLDQYWRDDFLAWNPIEFNNLTTLRLPCKHIWLPDIVLYNNAAEYNEGHMEANVMVHHDGKIFWPVPTKLQSSCKIDVTFFPFDSQECKMKFGSWTYDGFQVDIIERQSHVDLSNYIVNGEWHLSSVKSIRNEVIYSCCVEPYPDVTFTISIDRKTLYYLYNIIFPCILMSALTVLCFSLPPDSGEKIALGVTVLLAFSVFMLSVTEKLPETSESVPIISIYLTIVMSMTSLSVIMTVFVLNIHHRGPKIEAPPAWVNHFILEKLSKYVCVSFDHDDDIHLVMKGWNYIEKYDSIISLTDDIHKELRRLSPIYHNDTTIVNKYHLGFRKSSMMSEASNDEIMTALKNILTRHQDEATSNHIRNEWRKIALVIDKVMLFVFLILNILGSCMTLVVLPAIKS